MLGYLAVLFLALPFIDLYLLLRISGIIGFLETLGLVIITGVVGVVIVRREGRSILRRLQNSVTAKEVSRNLLEGMFLVIGGVMLLSPGLLTDALGLLFVLQPSRSRLVLHVEDRLKTDTTFTVRTYDF